MPVSIEDTGDMREIFFSCMHRIEKLEEIKDSFDLDIKDVYAKASDLGIDPHDLSQAVKIRKLNPDTRREFIARLRLIARAVEASLESED